MHFLLNQLRIWQFIVSYLDELLFWSDITCFALILRVLLWYYLFAVKQVTASGKVSAVQPRNDERRSDGTSLSVSGIIYSLFQAQFRSVVKCPVCLEETSNTEPFLFVPLSLPDVSFSVSVTVVCSHPHHSVAKMSVNVSCSGTVRDLRTAVAASSNIPVEQARQLRDNLFIVGAVVWW